MASVPASLISSVSVEFEHVVVPRDTVFSPEAILTSTSSAVFACHSAACAPPPPFGKGTGGSKGGSGGGGRGGSSGSGSTKGGGSGKTAGGAGPKSLGKGDPAVASAPRRNVAAGGKAVSDVHEAARLVGEGKAVKLKPPADKQVATLVDELAKQLKDRPGDTINLCKVSVPGTNLFCGASFDIPRQKMPQLGGMPRPGSEADKMPKNSKGEVDVQDGFIEHLKKNGVKVTDTTMPADQMKASQMEVRADKTHGMANNKDFDPNERPIVVSRDGYIVDGHHRWSAQILRDYMDGKLDGIKMKVQVVDMDARDLLDATNAYTDSIGILPKSGASGGKNT